MKFAIVESGGKQFRAVEGGTIEVDRLSVELGTNVKFDQVLMLADGENITVGTPVVQDCPIWATVVEHFRGEKVTIFNYSPKKRIRIKTGHRQNYTRLLVEQIGGAEPAKKEAVKVEKPAKVAAEKPVKAEKAEKTEKAAPKKTAAKPAAAKTEKPAKTAAEKPAKTETKKPAAEKKPAAKK